MGSLSLIPTVFLPFRWLDSIPEARILSIWREFVIKRFIPLLAVLLVACGNNGNPLDNFDANGNQQTDSCIGVDCGAHAFCAVGPQGPICVCERGLALKSGACEEPLDKGPCKGLVCAGNGVCRVAEDGTAVCFCGAGYNSVGTKCVVDEEPSSPCANVDCSGHGFCVLTPSNEALCICDVGYLSDGEDCISAPCQGVTCSGHGSCEIDYRNEASCLCEDGFISEGSNCLELCVVSCEGRECGPDGCEGVCGPGCGDDVCQENGLCPAVLGDCLNGWCLIPAGTFSMGSFEDEACRRPNEGPVHLVTITRSFFMKQTEVTQLEWVSLMGNNPSKYATPYALGVQRPDFWPVDQVNWYDAVHYANALSTLEGFETCYTITDCEGVPGKAPKNCTVTFNGLDCEAYRLPTEAEWEYATRAETTTAYWIGDNIGDGGEQVCGHGDPLGVLLPLAAWYGHNSGLITHVVKQLKPNPWGLYDVHGNAGEWVNDWWDEEYYATCDEGCIDPLGPETGSFRVYRGGSSASDANELRSAYRDRKSPNSYSSTLGFRLVRSVVP